MEQPDLPQADLVLEGGGVKGIATAGVVTELMKAGFTFPRVAGTSVGAIAAAFVAALAAKGEDASRLAEIMGRLDLARVPHRHSWLPVVSEGWGLFTRNGLYSTDYLHGWLLDELADLGVRTFADLRWTDPGADPKLSGDRGYRLVVMATDVTHGRLLRLPWDYRSVFGRNPDDEVVADAIRMSLSIPLYFEPCELTDIRDGTSSMIVDGGVLSNFPVEIFDRTDGKPPRWDTFGVRLLPDLPEGLDQLSPVFGIPAPPPIPLLTKVVVSAIVGRDQSHLEEPGVRERTIRIDTSGFGFVDFSLGPDQRDELVGRGVEAARRFLDERQRRAAATAVGSPG